jgi:hypothetical protein
MHIDTDIRDDITETLTQTIRTVPVSKLGLPYVKYERFGDTTRTKRAMYPLTEVITDYGTDKELLKVLLDVLVRSDCELVAAYRQALADHYNRLHADDIEGLEA